MRVVICGANGAMGKLLQEKFGKSVAGLVSADGLNGVPRSFEELGDAQADVVVDFSHHTAIADVLAYSKKIGAAAVIGYKVAHTVNSLKGVVFYGVCAILGIAFIGIAAVRVIAAHGADAVAVIRMHIKIALHTDAR